MTHFPWSPRRILLSVALVALAGIAAAASIGLAYPEPVASGALGPDWQCTRLALVFTSCAPVAQAEPVTTAAVKDPLCRRGMMWRAAATSR